MKALFVLKFSKAETLVSVRKLNGRSSKLSKTIVFSRIRHDLKN